jgi:hypothetical protein
LVLRSFRVRAVEDPSPPEPPPPPPPRACLPRGCCRGDATIRPTCSISIQHYADDPLLMESKLRIEVLGGGIEQRSRRTSLVVQAWVYRSLSLSTRRRGALTRGCGQQARCRLSLFAVVGPRARFDFFFFPSLGVRWRVGIYQSGMGCLLFGSGENWIRRPRDGPILRLDNHIPARTHQTHMVLSAANPMRHAPAAPAWAPSGCAGPQRRRRGYVCESRFKRRLNETWARSSVVLPTTCARAGPVTGDTERASASSNVAKAPTAVVVGGGWAGFGAAWQLLKYGFDVTLLDASPNPGGLSAG